MGPHFFDGVTLPMVVGWLGIAVQAIFGVGYLVGRGDRASRKDQGVRIGKNTEDLRELVGHHKALAERIAALEASRKLG